MNLMKLNDLIAVLQQAVTKYGNDIECELSVCDNKHAMDSVKLPSIVFNEDEENGYWISINFRGKHTVLEKH